MSNEILGPRQEKVPRTVDYAKYKANFDAIFRKKKPSATPSAPEKKAVKR